MLELLSTLYLLGLFFSLIYLFSNSSESKNGVKNFFYASIWFIVPIIILVAITFIFLKELFKVKDEDSDTSA